MLKALLVIEISGHLALKAGYTFQFYCLEISLIFMQQKTFTLNLDGKDITATFSDLVDQANGSVMLSCQNTVVLATAVMSGGGGNNPGYFNLQVEYSERHYADGKILGARYTHREGKPTDRAILSSRIIDRTLRPLFDQRIKNAIQIVTTVLSLGDYDPTILAVNAASLALATSDIPWAGPVGAVQLWQNTADETAIINGRRDDDVTPFLDLVVCGQTNSLNMIEVAASEISEDEMAGRLQAAATDIATLTNWQQELVTEMGREKQIITVPEIGDRIKQVFAETMATQMATDIFGPGTKDRVRTLHETWMEHIEPIIAEEEIDQGKELANQYFDQQLDQVLHQAALTEGKRADLRTLDQVRTLSATVGGISPLLHGTGIFYRGGTHNLSVVTLGGPDDQLLEDGMEVRGEKRFFHHYNFPPYSAGETGRMSGPNRRAIGHGMLGEKALRPVLPTAVDFPYTIRVVSESMASDGSTSQASICAASLALMDAGVPITKPVAGIAMGIMTDPEDANRYAILTDVQAAEDHHGDMDFKVAGTTDGITAIQMDIKVSGVSLTALADGLAAARTARLHILETMTATIDKPRADISPYAPKIVSIKIPVELIGRVIGTGGDTIKKLQESTDTVINIDDDGTVFITGQDQNPIRAREAIADLTKEWNVGDKLTGKVIKILDEVGAIVSLSAYADGMVHISEIGNFRVNNVNDVLHEGMEVPVTVIKVDKQKGRIGLSIKQDNPDFVSAPTPTATTQ